MHSDQISYFLYFSTMAGSFLLCINRSIHRLYCTYARFVSSLICIVFNVPSICLYFLHSFPILKCILTYSLSSFLFRPWQTTSYLASIYRHIDSTARTPLSFHRRFALYSMFHRLGGSFLNAVIYSILFLFLYAFWPTPFLPLIFDHGRQLLTT